MWNGSTLTAVYADVLRDILRTARVASPRGLATFEFLGASISLTQSTARTLFYPDRKFHLAFACMEALWNLAGQTEVSELALYAKRMSSFSDDGRTLRSCYGARMYGEAHHIDKAPNQLVNIARLLIRDPESRQAIIMFRYPADAGVQTKDAVCGTHLQFLIRENKLHAIFSIRSNDVWLGVPYDVFTFSIIQQVLAAVLSLEPGSFTVQAGSLHLYTGDGPFAPDEQKLSRIINSHGQSRNTAMTGFPSLPVSADFTYPFNQLTEEHAAMRVLRIMNQAMNYYRVVCMLRKVWGNSQGAFKERVLTAQHVFADEGGDQFWRDLLAPIFLHWILKECKREHSGWNKEGFIEKYINQVIPYACLGVSRDHQEGIAALAAWYWQPSK